MTTRTEPAAEPARINALYIADPCPPHCWHHVVLRGGQAMRWTPATPALRFGPDGPADGEHGVAR